MQSAFHLFRKLSGLFTDIDLHKGSQIEGDLLRGHPPRPHPAILLRNDDPFQEVVIHRGRERECHLEDFHDACSTSSVFSEESMVPSSSSDSVSASE